MTKSEHDVHKCDPYIKILGNITAVIVFAIVMLLIGGFLSIVNEEWSWFSRFGSLVTITGLFLLNSDKFRNGIYGRKPRVFGIRDEAGKQQFTSGEDRINGNAVFLGIIITVIGTIIWGFGDLVGCFIK